jgi:serralysin
VVHTGYAANGDDGEDMLYGNDGDDHLYGGDGTADLCDPGTGANDLVDALT